jgi:putative ABC transport system permease protein
VGRVLTIFDEDYTVTGVFKYMPNRSHFHLDVLCSLAFCIGLLGLASFAVEQRTKEIGIRKVPGASVQGLVLMLSSEFARWVALANLIAWPLAYYLMSQWLRGFVYRTGIGLLPFIFSAVIVLGVAALTVGYHAVRSAVAKPVDSLRYQ